MPSSDPLSRLPVAFAAWEELAARLSALSLCGAFPSAAQSLPLLDDTGLDSRDELERAMLLLSVLGNAHVWAPGNRDRPILVVPRPIAVPWCSVAARLGRPPIVSHASIVLRNWRRVDPDGPLTLDNLEILQCFDGSQDEQWFYLIPLAMEAHGAEALRAIVRLRDAVEGAQKDTVERELRTLARVVDELTEILNRTPEHCDPYIFYHRVRPYLTGWPSPGVVYEGVHEHPVMLAGGSAAQSSLFQAIDAALGVVHEHADSKPFLLAMRDYMPPAHRAFLDAIDADGPKLRTLVTPHTALAAAYDETLHALDRFRKTHFEMATRYIARQAPKPDGATGTGGTELTTFLKKTREETQSGLLEDR